jgi:oligopeptide transport system ATP-binding protein
MLLDVRNLRTHFHTRRGVVRAVDGVSLSVDRGETLGLVGESGSGKSVVCSSIMRLVPAPAGRIVSGQLWFEGEDLLAKSRSEMREVRGRKISLILQDPQSSLNPSFTVASQVGEAIRLHQGLRGDELRSSVIKILSRVGIPEAERRMKDFPHQLSGGMRQRVAGAIALSCQPALLLADEPTTSLDVTVQAQYLRLLKELQGEFAFGLIFVTHDFGIVAKMCDQVAVMYAGRISESGSTRQIFNHPAHPYSKALLSSIPRLSTRGRRLPTIDGQPPIPIDLPPGCSFAPRCPEVMEICRREAPEETEVAQGHQASCWLHRNTEHGPRSD